MNEKLPTFAIVCLTALAIFTSSGCLPSEAPTGTVTGSVTVKGKPLTNAMVTIFSPAIGRGTNCRIDETGGYVTPIALPLGSYAVVVEKVPPPAGEIAVPGMPPGVPGEYGASHTTPLKVEVVAGETKYDVAIP